MAPLDRAIIDTPLRSREERVDPALAPYRGVWTMSAVDPGLIGQIREQPDRTLHGTGIAAREVRTPHASGEERVSGHQMTLSEQAYAARRVAGGVNDRQSQSACLNDVAVHKKSIGSGCGVVEPEDRPARALR
ncbi:MAG: hypothetical protein FD171_762 [Actinobacteria bacterium]|nr:MAG: hypothetical protein FD171_762 [Actinomycetota bacterium]